MKPKFIDPLGSPTFKPYSKQVSSPYGESSLDQSHPFLQTSERSKLSSSKLFRPKKPSFSFQRSTLEPSFKLPLCVDQSFLLRNSTTSLEKIRRTKEPASSLIPSRSSSKHNQSKEFIFPSSNTSMVQESRGRSIVFKEKSPQIENDSTVKSVFQKTFINNKLNPSSQYSVADSQQNIAEYKGKITSIQEKIFQLIGNSIWDQEVTQQFQTYAAQTKMALDKAYSKYILFPDIEQDLMDTLTLKELSFVKLIKLIRTSLSEALEANLNMKQGQKALEDDHKKLKARFYEDRSPAGSPRKERTLNETNSLLQNKLKNSEMNERVWIVEKQQMAAQIEKLMHEIEEVQHDHNFKELRNQYDSYQAVVLAKMKEMEKELDEREVKILKLENQLVRSTTVFRDLQKEYKDLTQRNSDLASEFTRRNVEHLRSDDEITKYKEISFMSREEILYLQTKCDELSSDLQKTTKKYMDAQYKLDKIKREQSEMSAVNEEEFQKDSSLLSVIKESFSSFRRQPIGLRTQTSQVNLLASDLITVQTVQLDRYSFNKPSFYAFIQQEFEAEMEKYDPTLEEKGFSIDRESLSLIRAIFDSKYNEASYLDDYKSHSQFPDFVYSWLLSFYVCQTEKKIKITNGQEPSEVLKRRMNLYRFLMNPKMNKIWDVATFRDFLEEKCAPDEVFFYLNCRYLLFQGPQLNSYGACMNPIHWILFDKVEKLIEIVLTKLSHEDFNAVKYKLRERAKRKNGKFFIDSGFVLRVLLEFYRNEKKIRLVMLQDTLNKVSIMNKSNKPHITFEVFKQFMETNYPFASEVEKAKLYRDAWFIGSGRVDYESFHIAASECNFFTSSLRYFTFNKIANLEISNITPENQERLQEVNKLVSNKYKDLVVVFEKSLSFARSLGIESVVTSISQMENNLTKKFNLAYDESKGFGLYILFNQLIQAFIKIRNQYFLTYRNSPEGENSLAKNDHSGIDILMESIVQYAIFDQADIMERNNKIRKFQLYYRHKKSNWFGLMTTMLQKVRSSHLKTEDK